MEYPLKVDITATDGICGRSMALIINPINAEVTHLVVQVNRLLDKEVLVPTGWIASSDADHIRLNHTAEQVMQCTPFNESHYIGPEDPSYLLPDAYAEEEAMLWPYASAMRVGNQANGLYLKEEAIPHGELAVHRGAHVAATDGRVGQVDEFLVEPEKHHITHLILRRNHLWGARDVTIPLSAIDHIADDTVYLSLTKKAVAGLPEVRIQPHTKQIQ
ncbi:MAG: hypothetical protein WBO46_03965 [Caldilineaceae bacterium]